MRKRALRERDALIALEQAAREEAERARRRTALLADASDVLSSSLDSPSTIGSVAERAVPEFADWCVVDVIDHPDSRVFRRVAVAHCEQMRSESVTHLLCEHELADEIAAGGIARVIRGGEPELVAEVNSASLADLAARETSMAAFIELAAASYLIVPVRARGRTLGAISFISCDAGKRVYGPHDLRLAEDLAHRVAVSLDNARLYREAQDANRMKDDFLAVVSHEMRTPLNAILGWAQLLRQGSMDDTSVQQGMGAIERNARSQARIIEDVLDVSRIIQGKLRLDVKPTDMRPIVEEALDVVRPAAEAKQIRLQARLGISADPANRVNGDAERLRQVVWNLLSNAVKFTPERGRVDVGLTRDANACHIELRVQDTGKGIDPRFLPHVFERFRQADSTTTRKHGGLGLGLAIVRHLVELHGGTVHVQSAGLGKGATFTVRLPCEHRLATAIPAVIADEVPPGGMPRAPIMDAHPELAGLRVLLVEDEPDARELFSSMLEMCGAEVMAVASVHDALDAFRLHRPDVILSDIGMPGEDGYTLIRQVRELEGESAEPTPAMAITAFAGSEDRKRALREGYQMHVAKPIGSAQFAAAVAALARNGNGAAPSSAESVDEPQNPSAAP
jgi:signal transduction histidine kinase/ActR/RegA family two-component response regulator